MPITIVLAIYFLTWWVVLFAVLPWGAHSQDASGEVTPGTEPGAPPVHRVWIKLLWTTIIASVLFAIMVALYETGLIPIHYLTSLSAPPQQ
jgi:predicted secreted protein